MTRKVSRKSQFLERPFPKRFALWYRTVVCPVCLSVCLSVTLVYCGQTVGWIKMKLGTEVGLGPGHVIFESPKKGAQPSNFRPMCIVAKRSPILATAEHLSANIVSIRCIRNNKKNHVYSSANGEFATEY